jgi:hypothetical protein
VTTGREIAATEAGERKLKVFVRDHWDEARNHPVVAVGSAVLAVAGAFGVSIPTDGVWPALAIVFFVLFLLELLVAWRFWRTLVEVRKETRTRESDLSAANAEIDRLHQEIEAGSWKPQAPRTSIVGRTCQNERVELDGHSFSACNFINVTLVYRGRQPFDFVSCNFSGFVIDADEFPQIGPLVLLMQKAGMLKPDTVPALLDAPLSQEPSGGPSEEPPSEGRATEEPGD